MVPQPPIDMRLAQHADWPITAVMVALASAALVFAMLHWLRSGRPVVLMLFLAGGCMAILEPMVDTVGGCWFPRTSTIAFFGWGRPLPVWLCLTYFVYFGLGAGLIWIAMRRGLSARHIWMIFVAAMVSDLVLETILIRYGLYTYYGWQPLLLGSFPLWWAAVNALVVMAAAAVTWRVEQAVSGWRLLLLVPAVLCTSAAMNAAAGWPSWFVINTDTGPVLTQIGGLASFAVATWMVQLIIAQIVVPGTAATRRMSSHGVPSALGG